MRYIILALIAFGGWQYYSKNFRPVAAPEAQLTSSEVVSYKSSNVSNTQSNFKCDGRQHCSQMRSYEEAEYFLRHCPNTKMDGDRDGIPCEKQFGRY